MADVVVTAGNCVTVSGATQQGTAGGTITAGMSVYRKTSDSKWYGAQCDGTAEESGSGTLLGIALCGASAGQPVVVQTSGTLTLGGTLTVGATAWVGSGTGGITITPADLSTGRYTSVIGIATTTAILKIQPLAGGVAVSP